MYNLNIMWFAVVKILNKFKVVVMRLLSCRRLLAERAEGQREATSLKLKDEIIIIKKTAENDFNFKRLSNNVHYQNRLY